MKQFKNYHLPELQKFLAKYTPSGFMKKRRFRKLVKDVLIEAAKGENDEKLVILQQQYRPVEIDHLEWNIMTSDIVSEYRKAVRVKKV